MASPLAPEDNIPATVSGDGITQGDLTPNSPESDTALAMDLLDEESALKTLTENVRDQDDLERDISLQANRALIEAEDKKDQKRIEKAELSKSRLANLKRTQEQKLRGTHGNPTLTVRIQREIARIDAEIEICVSDIADFNARIAKRHQDGVSDGVAAGSDGRLPNETRREFLIRTGKITPFAQVGGPLPDGVQGDLANAIVDAEDEAIAEELEADEGEGPRSHRNLRLPGFTEASDYSATDVQSEFSLRPRKRRRLREEEAASSDEFTPAAAASGAETPDSFDDGESDDIDLTARPSKTKRKAATKDGGDKEDLSGIDDGNEDVYQRRLNDWVERRSRARLQRQEQLGQSADGATRDDTEEWFKPSPDQPDHEFPNGLRLPGDIYPSLFDYQKTAVQWLGELYSQRVGGIIGDEMGLGKTGRQILLRNLPCTRD